MMRWKSFGLAAGTAAAFTFLTAADATRAVSLLFEKEAREVAPGRSPKFLTRGAQGLLLLSAAPGADGKGQDLFLRSSSDGGDTFSEAMRVNQTPGEVSDGGENSAVLAAAPDHSYLYAVWMARDPRTPMAGLIRFARSAGMSPSFSPALTINDDSLSTTHSYQTLGVAPDGAIYVAWLDGRETAHSHHGPGHAPIMTLFLARSTDKGRTFGKNIRVAGNICPCCRPSIAFLDGKVFLAWRSVESGDIRDMFTAFSSDQGQTWSQPVLVARDGWKLNGCPHVGPAMAALGGKLHVAWYTEGGADPGVYLAASEDAGRSFRGKRKVSGATLDPTHPQLAAAEDKLALVFQARSGDREQGRGRVGVYYR